MVPAAYMGEGVRSAILQEGNWLMATTRFAGGVVSRSNLTSQKRAGWQLAERIFHELLYGWAESSTAGKFFSTSQHDDVLAAITRIDSVSYTHLRAHETRHDLVCRLLLEKKK